MATKKDILSELIADNSKTKVLDRKWRSRKPEKADFNLEGVDIPAFCVGRKKFYAEIARPRDFRLCGSPSGFICS